jgi:hypothetical protein
MAFTSVERPTDRLAHGRTVGAGVIAVMQTVERGDAVSFDTRREARCALNSVAQYIRRHQLSIRVRMRGDTLWCEARTATTTAPSEVVATSSAAEQESR